MLDLSEYEEVEIIRIATLAPDHVWDVTLLDDNVPLPKSIETNGIITHNSTSPDYLNGIIEYSYGPRVTLEKLLGVKDDRGNYVVKPYVRPYNASVAEDFFDPVSSILRRLPDREYVDRQWFNVFEVSKENRKIVGDTYSKALYSKTGKFYVPIENGLPQAVFFVDSYPLMYPEKLDEDTSSAGLAAIARSMSANLPRVAPKLRRKGAVVIGVNQLRKIPMAMYGPSEQEPCGEAIRFASGVRVRQAARAIPHGKGSLEKEASVLNEGEDTYRYIHMKNIKNKGSTPYLEAWQRIWTDDGEGGAHGICPVYDTYGYLKNTGQATGPMKKITIPGLKLKSLTWKEFKGLILTSGQERKKLLKRMRLREDPDIRRFCAKQMKSGEGTKLMFAHIKAQVKGGKSEDGEATSEKE